MCSSQPQALVLALRLTESSGNERTSDGGLSGSVPDAQRDQRRENERRRRRTGEREDSENRLPSLDLVRASAGWEGKTHVDDPVLSELLRQPFCDLRKTRGREGVSSIGRRGNERWKREGEGGRRGRADLVSSIVPGDLLSNDEHSLISDHLLLIRTQEEARSEPTAGGEGRNELGEGEGEVELTSSMATLRASLTVICSSKSSKGQSYSS